ncbi:hypothetical protein GQX74_003465 [Glossina fuscipes]|nr:hypothetical protein GQX74_003465 [Glossina fuscipes]
MAKVKISYSSPTPVGSFQNNIVARFLNTRTCGHTMLMLMLAAFVQVTAAQTDEWMKLWPYHFNRTPGTRRSKTLFTLHTYTLWFKFSLLYPKILITLIIMQRTDIMAKVVVSYRPTQLINFNESESKTFATFYAMRELNP